MLKMIQVLLVMVSSVIYSTDWLTNNARPYFWDDYPTLYYPISTHFLMGVSAFGDSLELEDGSVWKIGHHDRYTILNWHSTDPLVITQNQRWLSSYNYRIVNQNTGAYVETNLFLGPLECGQNTLYITGIDRMSRGLITTNGIGQSFTWKITSADLSIVQSWALSDAIIVGQNSGWGTNYDTLLINVNMNNVARARQY